MRKIFILSFLVIAAIYATSCSKDTPTAAGSSTVYMAQFQQGILPSPAFDGFSDCYINSNSPDNIYADCTDLYVGKNGASAYRIGIICNLNSIPSTAVVTKAFLSLTPHSTSVAGVSATAYAQNVYWWPGMSGCDVAGTYSYDAKWNGPWSTPGGNLTKSMSTEKFVSYASANRQLTFELDKKVVENWIKYGVSTFSDANNGLLIASTNETDGSYGTFYSSEITTNSYYRPILTVYYSIP